MSRELVLLFKTGFNAFGSNVMFKSTNKVLKTLLRIHFTVKKPYSINRKNSCFLKKNVTVRKVPKKCHVLFEWPLKQRQVRYDWIYQSSQFFRVERRRFRSSHNSSSLRRANRGSQIDESAFTKILSFVKRIQQSPHYNVRITCIQLF